MKLFAVHFRQHVIPRLRNLAKANAVCVAHEVQDFSGACSSVMDYARRYGACYLPNDQLVDLVDWISDEVLIQIVAVEAVGAR